MGSFSTKVTLISDPHIAIVPKNCSHIKVWYLNAKKFHEKQCIDDTESFCSMQPAAVNSAFVSGVCAVFIKKDTQVSTS